VRTWSSIVWATPVLVFISGMDSHAQTPPACVVVEISTDPSDALPNNTSPELDRLYAKAEPTESSMIVQASRRTGAIKKGSRGQDDIAVTLSVRERAFLSGQLWTTYCPLNVVSQPAPPALASQEASHLSSRVPARPRIAPTRVAFAGHHGHTSILRRHELGVRGVIHSHYQAQVRSIGRHPRASAVHHKRA
jgi:hypothetical protein